MHETWLAHHGILGQKWGVRRFQNKDGSLTEAGKKRYLNSDGSLNRKGEKELEKSLGKSRNSLQNELHNIWMENDKKNNPSMYKNGKPILKDKDSNSPSKEETEKYKKMFPEMFKDVNEDDPEQVMLAVDDAKRYEKSQNKLKKKLAESDKKIEELYAKRNEEFDKLTEEETKYYDEESIKRTGMDYWTAFDKAVEQNALYDSGKIKYEDTLWKPLNDIEEEAFDIRKEKSKKIEEKYKPKILAETKKFVEAYMDEFGTNSIYYTDVEKLAKKGATYFMMDYLDEAGYEFDYSTEGYGSPYWKRKGA